MFGALDTALTAPLFATEAMRDCFSDRARLAAMLAMETALARAEAEHDLALSALAQALAAVTPDMFDAAAIGAGTALSGVPSIPFLKQLAAKIPAELEPFLHRGATTQDVLDTALMICARDALALLAADLAPLLRDLSALAETHRETACIGRTYGQHAAPISFGFKVAVWLIGIADAAAALPMQHLAASLAGPVGTLAGLNAKGAAVAESFSRILGFSPTPIAWHADRGRIAALGAWLAGLIGTLAKMATDIAAMAGTDIGELAEPHVPGRGGSSAMPHKRNPIGCTVILAAQGAAPGLAATLFTAMAAAHERPAGLWHAEWHALPSLFGLASGALHEACGLAAGLVVDPERMKRNIDTTRGLVFADAAAALLAKTLGRAGAHELVEHAADVVRTTDKTLIEALRADPRLPADIDLAAAFDPTRAVAAAGVWVDRAVAHAAPIAAALTPP